MSYIKYEMKFPIGSGITAWDLAETGKISWIDFGVYASFHRNSAWGYAGKVVKKSWKQWTEILNISRTSAIAHTQNLIDTGLVYKYPNARGQKLQFIVFKEALTAVQIEHYLQIFEANPTFSYIAKRSHPAETTEPEEVEKPYKIGTLVYQGDEYHCDGIIFRRVVNGEAKISLNTPEFVREHFGANGAESQAASA